jgi:pyruvate/2-oxoglutarate dehydrogenase complex dihydrolipoamide dehydrogenase (E3) component
MTQPKSPAIEVLPLDEYNRLLVANVHPADRVNPIPQEKYDLVVIGAGTAGLVVAAGAAGLGIGLKVALIEKNLMGGDCLNVGCVPSKCLIRSARLIGELAKAPELGIHRPPETAVDFAAIMERMRRLRSNISHHDSVQRFEQLGIDVFLGQGQFSNKHTITVAGQNLRFKKAVIATGAKAHCPDIPGLKAVKFLTNETVFSLTQRPDRFAVIGGGPIGCELAQAFQRFGTQVILFQQSDRLLTKADPEAAEIIQQTLIQEGVKLVLNCQITRVEQDSNGKKIYFTHHDQMDGQIESIIVDEILVGTGRAPNVAGLNLETVGVAHNTRQGIQVNDYLQTTNPQIYAAGDICLDQKFTHTADAAARIVIKNTLFAPWGFGRSKLSNLTIPTVTFTDPEIAQVGLSELEAQQHKIPIQTIKIPLSQVDRAITDGETVGFFKIHHQPGSAKILGATIVAAHAGEMISIITMAIEHQLDLGSLSSIIYPYPTQAEGIKKAADSYRRTLLTPRTQGLLKFLTKFS